MGTASATVIPLRPFENARRQAERMATPPSTRNVVRAVLYELHAGRDGREVARQLQHARMAASPQGGAA
ncbi:hypothetical protein [Marilutibacter alkalisoli]|uniref:Uncharacterized protein n=1 Tax=Marilutibacter alkalisoli TaxID=2591633 RepID=A0A514BU14_9GAMM|nr:hypothetical protein [Lysobacter alkalisoli]QDH70870.1 hypothetical protein FKV23_12830 [Lysobacter alkalisoli]